LEYKNFYAPFIRINVEGNKVYEIKRKTVTKIKRFALHPKLTIYCQKHQKETPFEQNKNSTYLLICCSEFI